MAAEEVTLGVPVYRGAEFVAETLRSIQGQTHPHLRVIVSLDGPDTASEEACRPFLRDPRFRVVVQPRHLGWAENISWLMDQVETPYWSLQPQDDLLDPRYLQTLLEHARGAPKAAITYCDIERFGGSREGTITQDSLTGSPLARQLTQLIDRHMAVAFRGLTRLEALRGTGGVPTNEVESYRSDTAWVSAAARYGEHHRVPLPLYRKRFHPANEHRKWPQWPPGRLERAWIVHCADMFEQAVALDIDQPERRMLWTATLLRLLRARPHYIPDRGPPSAGLRESLESFLAYVRHERCLDLPRLLGAPWCRIGRWTLEASRR
jgi:GT2 family glycosyltransferase